MYEVHLLAAHTQQRLPTRINDVHKLSNWASSSYCCGAFNANLKYVWSLYLLMQFIRIFHSIQNEFGLTRLCYWSYWIAVVVGGFFCLLLVGRFIYYLFFYVRFYRNYVDHTNIFFRYFDYLKLFKINWMDFCECVCVFFLSPFIYSLWLAICRTQLIFLVIVFLFVSRFCNSVSATTLHLHRVVVVLHVCYITQLYDEWHHLKCNDTISMKFHQIYQMKAARLKNLQEVAWNHCCKRARTHWTKWITSKKKTNKHKTLAKHITNWWDGNQANRNTRTKSNHVK